MDTQTCPQRLVPRLYSSPLNVFHRLSQSLLYSLHLFGLVVFEERSGLGCRLMHRYTPADETYAYLVPVSMLRRRSTAPCEYFCW